MRTDVRALLQSTLDAAFNDVLFPDRVRVFWRRRAESPGDDPSEYIVYTLDGDPYEEYADNRPLIRATSTAVRYYYRDALLDSREGRARIARNETRIAAALIDAGFDLPTGYFDAGDIDSVGFGVTLFPAEYWEALI